jgi:hypothetical protein
VLSDIFDREPLCGKAVPLAEREAWLANRVGPPPGTDLDALCVDDLDDLDDLG